MVDTSNPSPARCQNNNEFSISLKTFKIFPSSSRKCSFLCHTHHLFIPIQLQNCWPTLGCWTPPWKQRLAALLKGVMKEIIIKKLCLFIINFVQYFFSPVQCFMWGQNSSEVSPEDPNLWCCSDFVPTASSSTFTSPTAACTLSLTPTKLTSHSGYHTQQCLTKNLASTGQLQPQWLKHTAVRRQAGCNLQELLIQGNTQGVGQRD